MESINIYRFSLCVNKKKHVFGGRDVISLIESQVYIIFIPNDFPQNNDKTYIPYTNLFIFQFDLIYSFVELFT